MSLSYYMSLTPPFTGTANSIEPINVIIPDRFGHPINVRVTIQVPIPPTTTLPLVSPYYTFTWFKNTDVTPFRTFTTPIAVPDGTPYTDTSDPLMPGSYRVHIEVTGNAAIFGDITFTIRDLYWIDIGGSTRSLPRSLNPNQNKKCIPCSKSNSRSVSNSQVRANRDIVVNDVTVTYDPQNPDTSMVIRDALFCEDDRFTMSLTNLPEDIIDEEITYPSHYPMHLEINNITDGSMYVFDISLPEVIPEMTYMIPTTFSAGQYNVTVTNAYGNHETYTFTVTAPNIVELTISDPCPCVPCFGGSMDININVVMNNKQLWCDNVTYFVRVTKDGVVINPVTGETVNGGTEAGNWFPLPEFNPSSPYVLSVSAGLYDVTIIQVCGSVCELNQRSCEKSVSFKVCQPTMVRSRICKSKLMLDCNGDNDGYVDVWVEGGTPSYTLTLYKKNNQNEYIQVQQEAVDGMFMGLIAGCYKVVVIDSHGCHAQDLVFSVKQPDPIVVTFANPVSDKCGQRFSVQTYISGGTPFGSACCKKSCGCDGSNNSVVVTPNPNSYLFAWVNDAKPNIIIGTNSFITCLEPGTYTVTVRDSKCCVSTGSITLVAQPPTSLCVRVNKHKTCNDCIFTIDIDVDCGVPPYSYVINGETLDDDISCYEFNSNQTFKLKVTDSRGISGSVTF